MSKEQREAINKMLGRPGSSAELNVAERRAGFAQMMAQMKVAPGIRTSPTTLADRPALFVEPAGAAKPGTILYFHGGSNVFGSPQTALSLTAGLVVRTGIRSISLDYRLAPEHPFPAGLEDALTAYRELLASGADPQSIAFVGDSAGGGIAVGTCLLARDAGLPRPAAVAAFSAGLDYTHSGESMTTKEGIDPFFTRDRLKGTGALFMAGQDPEQELLTPATRADMSGFPPLLLQVGTNELLLDDSTRLAKRARDAGVDVILDVTANVPHVFQAFTGVLDEADQALDRAALFLTQHIS